jgi:hypothetical protein
MKINFQAGLVSRNPAVLAGLMLILVATAQGQTVQGVINGRSGSKRESPGTRCSVSFSMETA